MNEFHPDFDPTMLPLAEQMKYWERKNEKSRIEKERIAALPKQEIKIGYTHRK